MEISDHVPHRTTYRQNNSWMVHEFQQSGCLFVSQRTSSQSAGIHIPFMNCFVCRWFCVVHDPKSPLHSHNWLSFGKFQDTERFLIHCERHFSSRLPPAVEPGSTTRPLVQKKLGEILCLLICSFLPCLSWLLRSRVRNSRRDLLITLYVMTGTRRGEVIYLDSCITSVLDGCGCSTPLAGRFTLGKEQLYPLQRGLCGPQDRSEHMR